MLFEAYPIVFEVGHNMNAGLSGMCFHEYIICVDLRNVGFVAGLMFVPVLVGAIASVAVVRRLLPALVYRVHK